MSGRKLEAFPRDAFCLILEVDANQALPLQLLRRYQGIQQGREGEGKGAFSAAKLGVRAGCDMQRKPKTTRSFFVFSLGAVQNSALALMVFLLPNYIEGTFVFLEGFG